MGSEIVPHQSLPDHPSQVHLGAEEVEAIKIAKRALPEAMRNLVQLTRSRNPSQARQAIEVLFSMGLANRQQQFDIATHEPAEKQGGDTNINLTLNKVEVRLTELIQNMPPDLQVEFAELVERIEQRAVDINMPIIDGIDMTFEEAEQGPPCACGCGEFVKRLRSNTTRGKKGDWADFVHGHQLRGHMTHTRHPPLEIARLKQAGLWPPKDVEGNITVGFDKNKSSAAKDKKNRIKARKAAAKAKK
jgi:hypothetical protein